MITILALAAVILAIAFVYVVATSELERRRSERTEAGRAHIAWLAAAERDAANHCGDFRCCD